jgi:hypothetical protein
MFSKLVRSVPIRASMRRSGLSYLPIISERVQSSGGQGVSRWAMLSAVGAACCFTTMVTDRSAYNDVDKKGPAVTDKWAHTRLYPPISPHRTGMLKVSDIHSLAFYEYGNPKGKPVLFVHGGPGGGTIPAMARFFDPAAYRIILVDQRGCGNSTPFANLTDNTTYDSIRDFEKLREHLGINRWQVFGGSWGSTLGLAYAVSSAFLYGCDSFYFTRVDRASGTSNRAGAARNFPPSKEGN